MSQELEDKLIHYLLADSQYQGRALGRAIMDERVKQDLSDLRAREERVRFNAEFMGEDSVVA